MDKKFSFKGIDPIFEFEPEIEYLSVAVNYHFGQSPDKILDSAVSVLGPSTHSTLRAYYGKEDQRLFTGNAGSDFPPYY